MFLVRFLASTTELRLSVTEINLLRSERRLIKTEAREQSDIALAAFYRKRNPPFRLVSVYPLVVVTTNIRDSDRWRYEGTMIQFREETANWFVCPSKDV